MARGLGYGVRGYGVASGVPWVTEGLVAAYIAASDQPVSNPTWGDDSGNNWWLTSNLAAPAGEVPLVDGPGFFTNERPGMYLTGGTVGFQDAALRDFDQVMASEECTIQTFVHPIGALTNSLLFYKLPASSFYGGYFAFDPVNQRCLWVMRDNAAAIANALVVSGSTGTMPNNADYMITCRANRSRSILVGYDAEIRANGVLHGSGNFTATPGGDPTAPFKIGYPTAGNRFTGYVGVVLLYNRCLTEAERIQNETIAPLLLSQRKTRRYVCIGDSTTVSSVSYRGTFGLKGQQTPNASNREGRLLVAVGEYSDSVSFPGGTPVPGWGWPYHFAVNGNNIQAMAARVPLYNAPGQPNPEHALIMAGTNNTSDTVEDALLAYGTLVDACRAKWGTSLAISAITPQYGFTPSGTNWSPDGWLGDFNAQLPNFCDNAGISLISLYESSGPPIWNGPGGDAADVVGHPTVAGGVTAGTLVAWHLGIRP